MTRLYRESHRRSAGQSIPGTTQGGRRLLPLARMRAWVVTVAVGLVGCGGSATSSVAEGPDTSSTGVAAASSGTAAASISIADLDDGAPADTTSPSDSGASTGAPPAECEIVGVAGDCADVSECGGGAAFQGVCGGEPSNQCCIAGFPACSRFGAPGLCVAASGCPDPWEGTDGICPGGAAVECCTDPLTRCGAEAMPLPNEGLVQESWDPQCPDGMVYVETNGFIDAYCIDKYEAALVVLDDEGQVASSWSPYHFPGATRVAAVSLRGAVPQGYMTSSRAAEACSEAGKQLCESEQWLRACRGPDFFVFPYGNQYEPLCNDSRPIHPAMEYFGSEEGWVFEHQDHPCLSQLPQSLHVTGQNAGCVSGFGAVDMMGNLSEWTTGDGGTMRGGDYWDAASAGPGCYFNAPALGGQMWNYATGFRCCADPL